MIQCNHPCSALPPHSRHTVSRPDTLHKYLLLLQCRKLPFNNCTSKLYLARTTERQRELLESYRNDVYTLAGTAVQTKDTSARASKFAGQIPLRLNETCQRKVPYFDNKFKFQMRVALLTIPNM